MRNLGLNSQAHNPIKRNIFEPVFLSMQTHRNSRGVMGLEFIFENFQA